MSWRSLRPIKDLIKTVKKIKIGDMDVRVPVRNPNNELGELSGLFNTMLEKIDGLIKGMKESLDNVAHDLRTPLSRMRANLEIALQSKDPSENHEETLVNCVKNVERISIMLKVLLDITKAESGIFDLTIEEIDLRQAVKRIETQMKSIVYKARLEKVGKRNHVFALQTIIDKEVIVVIIDPRSGQIINATEEGFWE